MTTRPTSVVSLSEIVAVPSCLSARWFQVHLVLLFALLVGVTPFSQAWADQTAYDSGNPTAEEQYILELINRARSDPAAEGIRLGININEGLMGATAVIRPPLAMNKLLLGTARAHSDDMFTRNYFAHSTPEGLDPFERIDNAGYISISAGENIAKGSTQAGRAMADLLMIDRNYPGRGHRLNLLDIGSAGSVIYREIGIGLKSGQAMSGTTILITQDFGRAAEGPFVLGVVYNDTNQNGFYDTGEGLAGVSVTPDTGGFMAVTADAGGFAFPVGTSGTLAVTASGGGLLAPLQGVVTLTGQNVKLDFTLEGAVNPPAVVKTIAVLRGAVTGAALGTTYATLGLPQGGAFAGAFQVGKVKTAAVFAADGSVLLKGGDEAPGLAGSRITKLGEPSGDAVRATLAVGDGSVSAKDNEILLGGLTNGPLVVVARKGQTVTGLANVTVKKILQFDGAGPDYFFLAQLQGDGVTAKNDSALCVAPGDGSVRVVVREQQVLGLRTVSTIAALVALPGTLGEGRWRATANACGVRVIFADKGQQCFTVPATATTSADWIPWASTGDALQGGVIKTLGIPGFGATGMASTVTLKTGTSPVSAAQDTLLIRCASGSTTVLATEGGTVPDPDGTAIPGASFKTFGAPVCGASGRTAFAATLAGVKGNAGIWYAADGATLKQLARVGEAAPGGGHWAKIMQLALSDEAAGTPYLMGTLAVDRSLGISSANNTGLWALNTGGDLVLLLHTGRGIDIDGTLRTLKSFTTFTPGTDSPGSAHGYDAAGHIVVRATFTDQTVALLQVTVP